MFETFIVETKFFGPRELVGRNGKNVARQCLQIAVHRRKYGLALDQSKRFILTRRARYGYIYLIVMDLKHCCLILYYHPPN